MEALNLASAPFDDGSLQMQTLCSEFVESKVRSKYILGRNVYVNDIVKNVSIDGFIDDYTNDQNYLGYPIVKTGEVPLNALVLIAAGGRPFTAIRNLEAFGLEWIDYFSFYKWSGLPLKDIVFNEGFVKEYSFNRTKFEWAYQLLSDDISREQFKKLVSFRLDYNLRHLEGFTNKEDVQYFEPFLDLKVKGEIFVDVGGYDGYTSQEFAKRSPGYDGIHIFEPDPSNILACKNRLAAMPHVSFHQMGLAETKKTLRFHQQGSGSFISDSGEVIIEVDRLDDVLSTPVTFIKMDIEGAELGALEGARQTVERYHPKLAISAYHQVSDFWRIPEKILSIRKDYKVHLRHYTESIYETVMFFVPD